MKTKKRIVQKTTLDKQHFQKIHEFDKDKEKLLELKKNLRTFKKELSYIENEKEPCNYTNQDIIKRAKLKDDIDKIEFDIETISSCKNELLYIKQTDDLLDKYFNNTDKIKDDKPIEPVKIDIMEFMRNKNNNILENDSKKKLELYDEYMDRIDKENIYQKRKNTDICENPKCKGQLMVSYEDGCLICSVCSMMNGVLIDTEKVGNKENGNEKTVYAYKRLNHLKEIINQIQGQESVEIKDSVYADITLEMNRRKLNKKDIDFFKMKKILKKLKYDKYYEHTSYIVWRICGILPPTFPRDVIERIEKMFNLIQKPFEMFRPSNRKNFLSYSYILHKFFDMMNMPEYLVYFKLLKNRKKRREQEKVFKQICEYLNWPFKSSGL